MMPHFNERNISENNPVFETIFDIIFNNNISESIEELMFRK